MSIFSSYLYIPVSDFKRSAEWYKQHFGFRVVKEDALFLELRSEFGVRVMLIMNEPSIHSHMDYSTGTQAAYGFVVPNIHEIYQELASSGVEVMSMTDYEGTSFKFYDPDRNIIELWGDYPEIGWTTFERIDE